MCALTFLCIIHATCKNAFSISIVFFSRSLKLSFHSLTNANKLCSSAIFRLARLPLSLYLSLSLFLSAVSSQCCFISPFYLTFSTYLHLPLCVFLSLLALFFVASFRSLSPFTFRSLFHSLSGSFFFSLTKL